MRLFTVLGIFFYATILILIGIIMVVFSFDLLQPHDINDLLAYAQGSLNSKIIIGLSGLLLVLISLSFAQLILGRLQREKTIAFTTSSGEVTIALSAVEDLIKRIAVTIPEIRELRPDVIATKKGVQANLKVVLKSEANIPDLTGRLQEITRSKIQEILGLEEQVTIRIHVAKIISAQDIERKRKEKDSEKEEPVIPFSGYGRV